MNTKISLELGIYQSVQICEVFRVTPSLLMMIISGIRQYDFLKVASVYRILNGLSSYDKVTNQN